MKENGFHLNGQNGGTSFGDQHRPELVRLLLQTLQSLGYKDSMQALQQESGMLLHSQHIKEFRSCLSEGDWDQVIALLPKLKISDDNLQYVHFLIYRQKYLELLERGERKAAVYCARNELSPLAPEPKALHKLTGLVMCPDPATLFKRAAWDGKDGCSRTLLLSTLHEYISSDQILQEQRLYTLLQQSQAYQRQHCLFHNTTQDHCSLLQDHLCPKSSIPQHTRCVLRFHTDEVWFVVFSHSGRYLATAGKDQVCFVFDTSSWADPMFTMSTVEPLHTLRGHLEAISFLTWSPDDAHLLTCSNDHTCRMWDNATGECVLKFTSHAEPVTAACWHPCGNYIVSAAQDKYVYKWDLTGKVKRKYFGARVNDIAISQDSSRMVTIDSDKAITSYNLHHPLDQVVDHDANGLPGPHRERHDDSEDEQADSEAEEELTTPPYKTIHNSKDSLTSLSLSNDGQCILVNKAVGEKKGCIHLYDLSQRPFKVVQKFTGHLQKRFVIRSCFGGANQMFVLSGSEDNRVYVYHRETGRRLLALKGHANVVNSVSWNPTRHNVFASGSDDGTVRIWTTATPPEDGWPDMHVPQHNARLQD
eukprot:NODE_616_length_2011_cov_48.557325_g572_i0.p1 GENE.NODE_616_length_2011_cov_48.557325_g572_i0~~NODE_616_length_2011_cov_48.557325_g572_i0.p1  ORF type:complete len:589 (-),score=177.28 NODE_616_length_2011_cov_48.557325_g572_i0:125-1891(-)